MRLGTSTVAAASVIAAGLAICGCSPSGSSNSSTDAATTRSATAAPGTTAQPAASATATSQNAQATGTCAASDLSFALGAKSGSNQVTQVVDLTNRGSSACTMDGFPGVDLIGTANNQEGYTWSLERSNASYSTVTLQPGETSHFDIEYLPWTVGGSSPINVYKFVITPPNTYTQAEVTWSQSVVLQDGATHPGTFITPVVSGS